MRRLLPVLFFLLASAQTPAPAADEAVHNALRQVKATMTKALNDRDVDTIVANVSPDIIFTTMNGDAVHGRDGIRAYFNKMMNAPGHIVKNVNTSFEADALTTLYSGGNVGIAYGSSHDHYELTTGQKFDINGRWTCTLVKQGDKWLIASFHYSTNVFDNPILAAAKRYAIWGAVAALVLGLVIGVLIGRRR